MMPVSDLRIKSLFCSLAIIGVMYKLKVYSLRSEAFKILEMAIDVDSQFFLNTCHLFHRILQPSMYEEKEIPCGG